MTLVDEKALSRARSEMRQKKNKKICWKQFEYTDLQSVL